MAATDQTYRPQRALDIVFGVSCVLMLVSIVGMFAQDYYREFKVEQRDFRDVEEAMAERQMLDLVPDADKKKQIEEAEQELAAARKERDDIRGRSAADMKGLLPKKVKADARAQAIKADYDSIVSIYNIEVERRNEAAGTKQEATFRGRADKLAQQVTDLGTRLRTAQNEAEQYDRDIQKLKDKEKAADDRVAKAEDRLKGLSADFDRFAKLAVQKRWKLGDWFRTLPVIDAFATPTKIQQTTLNDLPIDYNFKYVTRYDRCTTCHQGIDRPAYTKGALEALTKEPSEDLRKRLQTAQDMLRERQQRLGATDVRPGDVRLTTLSTKELSRPRVNEYCAHPRLDLFVDGNSAHPAESFGCTVCHAGQGSATDFNLASHTPNNATERKEWIAQEDWEPNHFWDFPMQPKRFVESSCLKCHHQVTDLLPQGEATEYREGKPAETPGAKVVRGYNLVRENGCFGCHEISGRKGGREVGPDLRLEAYPPLENMTPAERTKMLADPDNAPGMQRKVGPSLRRISEKTNQEWARKWLRAPRDFRPDTRMPHYYGLSNNHPEVLEPQGQGGFPDAEIHSIIYYVFRESRDYLKGKDTYYQYTEFRKKELDRKKQDNTISESELRELEEMNRRLEIAKVPTPLAERLTGEDGKRVELPAWPADRAQQEEHVKHGRQLFTEKGCLACHSHRALDEPMGDLPAVAGRQNFGPNLSRLAAKIAPEGGDAEARRRWLVQWIMNPNVHSPRTRMPVTHLDAGQAGDIAGWLLSRPADDWKGLELPPPATETLEKMARIYLEKALSRTDAEEILSNKGLPEDLEKSQREQHPDADELRLSTSRTDESWDDKLKWYVGRKAISNLGCFGCHDVPGFEWSKPIGTPLNDWGKKDPERIAFEDVTAYVEKHHYPVDSLEGKKEGEAGGAGHGGAEGDKTPYERFFWDALQHHTREGFLNQKLREPRSYDYDRLRSWEDRLRMPQFRFARHAVMPPADETDEQAKARKDADDRDEAEAREAVMTFILGLVAEPVPLKFVHEPAADKQAVARGKQVLEKFNCAGCHQLRPGLFEFKTSPDKVIEPLEAKYKSVREDPSYAADDFKSDPGGQAFAEHNAWVGRPQPRPDRVRMHGLLTKDAEDELVVRLTEALRFTGADKKPYDIPAAEDLSLPPGELTMKELPHGGTFGDLLVDYLVKRKTPNLDDPSKARSGLPPPLLREGERAQPGWLFQFLRSPIPVRPVTILRMPRFNMSDDDAQALVNYFGAVDRLANPGIGLDYPYLTVREREEGYLAGQTQNYVPRLAQEKKLDGRVQALRPIWQRMLKDRVAEVQEQHQAAEKAVSAAKPNEKQEATKRRDALKAELDKLQAEGKDGAKEGPFVQGLRREWEAQEAYATDAYRLLANYDLCLKCHQVGNLEPNQPIGPPLTLAPERLRPDWTRRWIASPQRLLIYPIGQHPMPQPFQRGKIQYPEFAGTPLEKATALRDVLMNYPRVSALPADRLYRPTASEGGQ